MSGTYDSEFGLEQKALEPALRAEWEGSEALRREFGDFETFAAFRAAESLGLVRIQGRVQS